MVDPLESLRELCRRDDHAIDIAEAAAARAIDRPGEALDPYRGTLAAVPAKLGKAPGACTASICRSLR